MLKFIILLGVITMIKNKIQEGIPCFRALLACILLMFTIFGNLQNVLKMDEH